MRASPAHQFLQGLSQDLQDPLGPNCLAPVTKKASSKRHSYRKRCKSGIYCDEVSLESLLRYTHLPAPAAAKELGMGITVFKKLCRLRGLQQWPYKKPSGAGARRLGRKARSAQEEDEWCSAESDDSVQSNSEEASSAALSPADHTHPHPDRAVPQPANLCQPPAPLAPLPAAPAATATVSASALACEEDESAESFDRLQLLLAAAECSAPGPAAGMASVLALSKARSTESALTNTACRLSLWQSGRVASEELLVPHPQTPMVHPVATVPDASSVRQLAQALASNKDLAQQLMAALDSVGVPHAPCSPNQPALPTPAAQQDWASPFAAAGATAPPSPQALTVPEWQQQQPGALAAAGRQGSSAPASPSQLAASPLAQRSAAPAGPFAISRAGSAFAPYTQQPAAALPPAKSAPAPAPAAGSRLPPPQALQRWVPYATAAAVAPQARAAAGPCRGRRALPASTAALHGLAAGAAAAAAAGSAAAGAAGASSRQGQGQGQGQSPQITLLRALISEHQRYKARMQHLKEILLSLPSRAASGEWQPVAC